MEDCDIFQIWEDYKSSLLGFIKKRVKSEEDAKDLLQEVLLKGYQYCSKGKTVVHIKAWLYKITQNTILDYLKKQGNNGTSDAALISEKEEDSLVGEASAYIRLLFKTIT